MKASITVIEWDHGIGTVGIATVHSHPCCGVEESGRPRWSHKPEIAWFKSRSRYHMNPNSQRVYVVFGRYTPEPYVADVCKTREEAEAVVAEMDEPDRYEISTHYV